MRGREEKRRKLHEALIQTLYPPSSPPSSPSSPVTLDDEPFDVTLIDPEDYVNIDSSNHDDDEDIGDESETKPSRAQRKRMRKKMLKEEAARRRKVIGPLLPTEMIREDRVAVAVGSSSGGGEEASCVQPARLYAQEVKDKVSFEGNDKSKKVKKRREAKKLAKEGEKKKLNMIVM